MGLETIYVKELEKRIKSIRQICTFGHFMVDSCTPGHFMVFLAACGFVSCASNHLLRGQDMPFLRPIYAVCHTQQGWTGPAGANCDGRPPSLSASNSRAFLFVTSVRPCSLPSKRAGLLLLSRYLCPDGAKIPSSSHSIPFVKPSSADTPRGDRRRPRVVS
jgi:hypothetical protein